MDYLERLSQPSAMDMARLGDFRAIAYWLNVYLAPQGIYARVAADRPGVLLVLLEFFQSPRRDRLTKVVCHRLCRLNSQMIRGVHILARFVGSPEILWDTSVRLVTPATRSAALPPARRRRRRARPMKMVRQLETQRGRSHPAPAVAAAPPRRRPRRAPRPPAPQIARSAPPVALLPAARSQSAALARRHPRRRRSPVAAAQRPVPHLTPMQWQWLGTSAAAVLLFGTGAELVHRIGVDTFLSQLWQPGAGSVRTASGRVPVIQTTPPDTQNPTVTLTFTGAASGQHPLPIGSLSGVSPTPGTQNLGATAASPSRIDPGTLSEAWLNDAPEVVLSDGAPAYVKPWPRADVSLANLNQPLAAALTTPERDSIKAPRPAAVNVVNVSSNAVAEGNNETFLQTLETLNASGLHTVGAGRNQREARLPEIVEVRGKRIAYLGYSDSEATAAGQWRAGSNLALEERITEDIEAIRDQVDWVVVNYHWSQDLESYPADWQMAVARLAIDKGADLVVGYHPNALQGAEVYRGRAIAYSLGNFVFPDQAQSAQPEYDSAVLKVSLRDDQMRLEFLPVAVTNAEPAIAQGQKAEAILEYLEQASAMFEQPLRSPMILNRLEAEPPAIAPNPPVDPATSASPEDSFISYPEAEVEAPPERTPFRFPGRDRTPADPAPQSFQDSRSFTDAAPPVDAAPTPLDQKTSGWPETMDDGSTEPLTPESGPSEAAEDSGLQPNPSAELTPDKDLDADTPSADLW